MDPTTQQPLRIAHCPGYAPAWRMHLIRKAEKLDADSYAPTEAYKVAPLLLERPRYDCAVGVTTTDTRAVRSELGDAGDNPILVHLRNPITRRRTKVVSAPGQPEKFAPERHGVSVTYTWQGRNVTHVSVHPDPLFCGKLVWLAAIVWALRQVRQATRRGDIVVLTGDLQTASKTLHRMLRAAGLVVHRHGIDYLCHNRAVRMVGDLEVVQQPQFDHPWLVANLQPRGA